MSLLGNLLGYQLVWFAAVYGAGAGSPWPAVIAATAFAAWQLSPSVERALDIRLISIAAVLGMVLDGALARSGMLRYAAAYPALPPDGAPLWILCLWVAFALTVSHSLRFLRSRPLLAALAGALGGPLAYAAAGRLAGAASFAPPLWPVLACLALGWGAAVPLLGYLAHHWARANANAPPGRHAV